MKNLMFNTVTRHSNGFIKTDEVRPATDEERLKAAELHQKGECTCTIVYDIPGFSLDVRKCIMCGNFHYVDKGQIDGRDLCGRAARQMANDEARLSL